MAGITHHTQTAKTNDPNKDVSATAWDESHDVASVAPSGLTGATSASRYVGGTTTGAPVSGTFSVGDYVVAQDGVIWVCTGAGSPGTWTAVSGGGGGGTGGLLAVFTYAPGTDTSVGAAATGSFADIDATNAVITFTAPASGKVLVRMSALQSGGGGPYYWGLRESASDIGTPVRVGDASSVGILAVATIYLTGISAGSHTYKWSHKAGAATYIYGGPAWGQIVMEVWDADPASSTTESARPYLDTYSSSLDATFGDDFDGASLNARWTRRNITSGMETYQSGNGSYLQTAITSSTVDQLYTQGITGLGDFDFICSFTVWVTTGVATMYGLFALTSAGAGRGILWYTDGTAYHAILSGYTYSTYSALHGLAGHFYPEFRKVFFRLKRVGTTVTTYISTDGDNWGQPRAQTDAATFDRIAIGRVYGGGTEDYWLIDRFDRVS